MNGERTCDACGKSKPLRGGKTCENGHFICADCVYDITLLVFGSEKKVCPICKKPLR